MERAAVDVSALAGLTVAEVMVRAPKVLTAEASLADVREALLDDHVHMVLLVGLRGRLLGTVVRDDLLGVLLPPGAPARCVSRTEGRLARPTERVGEVVTRLRDAPARRLAVVDADGRLVGLVCLKRSRRGFCNDVGVAVRAAARDR